MSWLLTLFSGLALTSLFPPFSIDLLAWGTLVPLLFAMRRSSLTASAVRAGVAGMVGYAGIFYWIIPLVHFNTGSLLQAVVCLVALSAYLALYFVAWSLCLYVVRDARSSLFVLTAAASWCGLEYLRAYALTGFPWALVGHSQYRTAWILTAASYTGVYGISFCIVAVNTVIYMLLQRSRSRVHMVLVVAIVGGVTIARSAYRHIPVETRINPQRPVLVSVIQPAIDQYKKWDVAYQSEIRQTYADMVREASAWSPRVIVWPETAVPGYLPVDAGVFSWTRDVVRRSGTINVVGTPYATSDGTCYNASLVFRPDGTAAGIHRKTHLVPFGEYVPLRALLAPYFGVLNSLGDFTQGTLLAPVIVDGLSLGITICSENMFAHRVRLLVKNGATMIVNQTNDAWFFRTAAAEQHFIMNVFRAVENHRPVVIAGNTGVSGAIGPDGSIQRRTGVFEKTFFTALIVPETRLTFYTRYGDVFALTCVFLSVIVLMGRLICWKRCGKN